MTGGPGAGAGRPVEVTVCGEVAVAGPGARVVVRGRQPQAVLAYLAIEDRPVQHDELADLLWGDRLGRHWQGALRGVVSKVRAALVEAGLPPASLRSEDGQVWLDVPGRIGTDVDGAQHALSSSDLAEVAAADATLARPFLPHNDSEWSRARRLVLDELTARAAHRHVALLLRAGDLTSAVARARARVAENPLDETAQHLLVETLLASGQRAEAVHAYEELGRVLRSELGVDPARPTADLVAGVLDGRASTPSRPPSVARDAPFHPHDGEPFVGRVAERAALAGAWDAVVAGRSPRLVVVEGPAGIGKTRLVGVVCGALRDSGVTVLWGRGRAGDGRAYGPLAEALSAALDADPALVDRLGERGAGLAVLLPELQGRVPAYRPPADPAVARTHLFAAVRAAVAELADAPCVLVLDDLHWIADDTVSLLEVVLDGLDRPLLVLATVRPAEGADAPAMAAVRRLVPSTSLPLEPLTVDDVADLVGDDPALGAALHGRTAGLPFLAAEIARDARQTGVAIDPERIPDGVRDWVSRRVGDLPEPVADDLSLAAVIGADVHLGVLERAAGGDPDRLARSCDTLVARGLLTDDVAPGHVAFSHAITRDVVYDALGPARRARLHRKVADALVAGPAARGLEAALAHHYAHAGPDLRGVAARYARLAGDDALAQGAWSQAEAHFAHSLDLAEDPLDQARALTGLGRARLGMRRLDDARAVLDEAIEVARFNGLACEQADAALALAGRAGRGAAPGDDDARQVARLRAALAALERDTSSDVERREVLRAHVERELAYSLFFSGDVEERNDLLARSVARIRTLDAPQPSALAAAVLGARLAKLAPDQLDDRLADVEEVLALPPNRLTPEVLLAAHCYRHEDLVRRGDWTAAAEALDAADAIVRRYDHPYWGWAVHTWRGLAANVAGDLDRAEELAWEASRRQPEVAEVAGCLGVNLACIRLYQGRAGEVLPAMADAADRFPHIPCYRAVVALCAAEAGDLPLAEASYRFFADHGFAPLPHDTNRFLALAVLADVAATLGDVDGGRLLACELTPYRGQWVVLNCYGGGGGHWGPASHQLARLAALDGRADDARVLLDEAESEAAAAGAGVVAARIAPGRPPS